MLHLVLLSDVPAGGNPMLKERMHTLLAKPSFRLAYLPSRSDRERVYFSSIKEQFVSFGITDFLYFDADEEYDETLIDELAACDGIYLSGGNTFYFLKNLQERNLLTLLHDMAQNGKLLIGTSAGSILMSHTIDIAAFLDPNIANLENLQSLGLVDFSFMPHWQKEQRQLPALLQHSRQAQTTIYTCMDGDGIVVQGELLELYGEIDKIQATETPKGS